MLRSEFSRRRFFGLVAGAIGTVLGLPAVPVPPASEQWVHYCAIWYDGGRRVFLNGREFDTTQDDDALEFPELRGYWPLEPSMGRRLGYLGEEER